MVFKKWFLHSLKFGHIKLLRELSHNEPRDFQNFLCMDVESYNELLQMVEPLIGKQATNTREPISPMELCLILYDSWFSAHLSSFFSHLLLCSLGTFL